MPFTQAQQNWIDRFSKWAEPRRDLRAALIFGSQARKSHTQADPWSDVDVAIVTSKPRLYTRDHSWMQEIAPLWTGLVDPAEDWGGAAAASGFSLYEGGLILDFVLFSNAHTRWLYRHIQRISLQPAACESLDEPIIEQCRELLGFFRRGTIVLLDRDGLIGSLEKAAAAIPEPLLPPPSAEEFQGFVDRFWIDPPRVAASLQRGKLAWAMHCTRPILKQLYGLAEWHARSKRGWDGGADCALKRIESWADPLLVEALPRLHAHYDYEDMWRALLETTRLFRQLTVETADALGYDCDLTTAEHASGLIQEWQRGKQP